MGWLDKTKQAKQREIDKLAREVDRSMAERKAKEEQGEAAIAPALAPYRKVVEEFCSQTGWKIQGGWGGPAGDKSLTMVSASRRGYIAGGSYEYHDFAYASVTSAPLRTSVGSTRHGSNGFRQEFSGISEGRLRQVLEAFYLWY